MLIGEHPTAMRPLKLLFVQQTGCDEQVVPPVPRIVAGEHVKPTTTSGPRTSPRSPRRRAATGLSAVVTLLQH